LSSFPFSESVQAFLTSPKPSKVDDVVQLEPWQVVSAILAAPALGVTLPFLNSTLDDAPNVIIRPGKSKNADEWLVRVNAIAFHDNG
jgi:hypothetical protein